MAQHRHEIPEKIFFRKVREHRKRFCHEVADEQLLIFGPSADSGSLPCDESFENPACRELAAGPHPCQ